MFNCSCCLFGRRNVPTSERLLGEERELAYNGQRYDVPASYKFVESTNFKEFLYSNPSTQLILGGWKLHISLDPVDIDNIARAWTQIIVPQLISCGIREFKIAKEAALGKIVEGAEGQGKLITIYLRHNPELATDHPNHLNLISILNSIEAELIQANIQPGPRPVIDSLIQGSQYMSFRCDIFLPPVGSQASNEGVVYFLPDTLAPKIAEENGNPAYNPFNSQDDYGLQDVVINSVPLASI